MIDCTFWFEYNISIEDDILESGSFGMDARDYLANNLHCNKSKLDITIKNKNDEINEIAEWAAYGCTFIDNILYEHTYERRNEIAKTISNKKMKNEECSFDDIFEDVFNSIEYKFTKVDLFVGDKKYVGR